MSHHLLGIFHGEGIGPEVTDVALHVLRALEDASGGRRRFEIREGGPIGHEAIALCGSPLSSSAIEFCQTIFSDGGAVLAGPGGDRFVYDCRRRFGLFHKLNPLIPSQVPLRARRIKDDFIKDVDIMVVRENMAGVYQGGWRTGMGVDGARTAHQEFAYSESEVQQVAEVACRLAAGRRGHLTIVTKPNGIPTISQLWQETVRSVADGYQINIQELEVDYATFAMVQNPRHFDVVVTSNLFGDILSDAGGILLGSRGLCFGGSFSADGAAIYQTNHGAAFDLAGTDSANPVGHLHALAMLLQYSFGLRDEALLIVEAIEAIWRKDWRTADLAEPGCRTIGTREMGCLIGEELLANVSAESLL